MGIAQAVMIIWMTLALVISLVNHGKLKTRREDCAATIIGLTIQAVVLYFGGFWD